MRLNGAQKEAIMGNLVGYAALAAFVIGLLSVAHVVAPVLHLVAGL